MRHKKKNIGMPQKKDSVTIQVSTPYWVLLELKRPDLMGYGRNYAIECLIAEACGLGAKPVPPAERSQRTAFKKKI